MLQGLVLFSASPLPSPSLTPTQVWTWLHRSHLSGCWLFEGSSVRLSLGMACLPGFEGETCLRRGSTPSQASSCVYKRRRWLRVWGMVEVVIFRHQIILCMTFWEVERVVPDTRLDTFITVGITWYPYYAFDAALCRWSVYCTNMVIGPPPVSWCMMLCPSVLYCLLSHEVAMMLRPGPSARCCDRMPYFLYSHIMWS